MSSEVQGASCADIYNAAIAGIQLPAQMVLDEEMISVCYTELDVNDLADYYGSTPMMMVHATEIAVFRPADKAAEKNVKSAIQRRVDDLYNIWSQYLPMQFELVENHQIVEKTDKVGDSILNNDRNYDSKQHRIKAPVADVTF